MTPTIETVHFKLATVAKGPRFLNKTQNKLNFANLPGYVHFPTAENVIPSLRDPHKRCIKLHLRTLDANRTC